MHVPIDSNGNLATKTEGTDTWGYEWNPEDQLTRVTKNSVEQARFSFDPLGRRVEKVAGGSTTSYSYDRENIIRELRGATVFAYIHGPSADEPLARDLSGVLTYYHADALGSIAKITDQAGSTAQAYQYDVWGNFEGGSAQAGYAFTGREWDPETALYHFRARALDTSTGRFLSNDPLWPLLVVYPFAYVLNNPASGRDPSGLLTARELADPFLFNPTSPSCFAAQHEAFGLLRMMANLEFTQKEFGPGPDKIAHCLAHCIIRKGCGPVWGNIYSVAAGVATEGVEAAGGEWARQKGYPANWKKHRWSWDDLRANEYGRSCPADVDCPSRCGLAGRVFGSN